MKRTLIKVTQEDIDKGCRNCITACPVARAVARTFNAHACVCGFSIEYNQHGKVRQIGHTPRSVERFICRFDSGKKVNPFNFFWKPIHGL